VQNNSTWAPSPPSRATWPAESFRPIPTLLVALGAIAVFVVVILAYLLVAIPAHWLSARQELPVTQLVVLQSVAYFALGPYLLVAVPAVGKLSLRQLGIRPPTLGEIGAGVLGALAMWVVVGAASAGMEGLVHRHDTETSIQLLRSVHTPFEKGAFIALALVFAPLVEELVFRVFLFNAFWRYLPLVAAALVSGWFWQKNNLNAIADRDDARGVCKIVNGGYNGLDSRMAALWSCKSAFAGLA